MRDDEIQESRKAVGGCPPVDSAGFVRAQTFSYSGLRLKSGAFLGLVTLQYEVYGSLSAKRDNAILVHHALSGSAHAAGFHSSEDVMPGWWDALIGPGKAFDTERYCVVAVSSIGSCCGSTGPLSVNPETGKPYAGDFPVITVPDMVNAILPLMTHLGIEQWFCVVGGSMGGMQVLQWGSAYPERVRTMIPIATLAASNAQSIAFSYVGRRAIMDDPKWRGGFYPPDDPPLKGLGLARMLGHITYLSDVSMSEKFGRTLQDSGGLNYSLSGSEFAVESYLDYQSGKFVRRFDANAYLVISRALDYFNLADGYASLEAAFAKTRSPALVISFSSDWIYPPAESQRIHEALRANHIESEHHCIESNKGHDAFLIEVPEQTALIREFLRRYES